MIRKNSEITTEKFDHRLGGDGYMLMKSLIKSNEELNDKGRALGRTILDPGCGIGYHVHNGESEIYYMLKGKAEYNDNGTITTLEEGDISFTFDGEGHGIKNNTDTPVEYVNIVLFK